MSISYVNSAAAVATSVAIPTHRVGDLLVVFCYRNANGIPTVPTAGGTVPTWTTIGSDSKAQNASIIAYAFATATNTTTGTWTNATHIHVLVYRGVSNVGNALENSVNINSNVINYPTLTLSNTNGTNWVIGAGGHKLATNVSTAPTGMVNRTSAGSGPQSATFDTNGGVTAWNSTNVTVDQSSSWQSYVVGLRTKRTSIIT